MHEDIGVWAMVCLPRAFPEGFYLLSTMYGLQDTVRIEILDN